MRLGKEVSVTSLVRTSWVGDKPGQRQVWSENKFGWRQACSEASWSEASWSGIDWSDTDWVRCKLGSSQAWLETSWTRDKLVQHESEQAETTTTTTPNRSSEIEDVDGHTKQVERKRIADDRSSGSEENDHNAKQIKPMPPDRRRHPADRRRRRRRSADKDDDGGLKSFCHCAYLAFEILSLCAFGLRFCSCVCVCVLGFGKIEVVAGPSNSPYCETVSEYGRILVRLR